MKKVLFTVLLFCSFSSFAIDRCFQTSLGQQFYTEMVNVRNVPSGHYDPPLVPSYLMTGFVVLNNERFPVTGSAILNNGRWSMTVSSNYRSFVGTKELNQYWNLDSNFADGKMFSVGDRREHSLFVIDCAEVR